VTYTAVTDESFGLYFDTLQLRAGSFVFNAKEYTPSILFVSGLIDDGVQFEESY